MKKLITPLLLCICAAINLKAQPQQTLKKASNIERNAIDNSVSSVTLTGDANYKIGQASELFRDYLELNTNKTQLVLRNSSVSKKGITTERYDQYCNGVKVENGVYTVMYGKDSRANFMNGNFYKSIPTSSTPTLNEKTAVAKALRAVNARKYAWEMEGLEQQLKIEKKDNNATYYPKGELVWIEDYTAQKSDRKLHLAYKFNVYAMEPLSRHHIYVDAKSGKILHKKSLIDQISGTGTTLYSGPVSFQTSILSGVNKLRDSTRGMGINTFSCANTTGTTVVDVTSASTVWATDASLDAHWGASKVFDYFMLEQGRNSFDDAGAAINSYVHFGVNYNNAFWNGSQMVYGDGSGLPSGFSPLTSLDVCAHEIGHAICQYTADLIYEKESGAMNEGFSDIWAAIIEEYADPHETDAVAKDKWKIGEEIGTNPIRRMDNPNIRYQPDTYGGSYWVNVSGCTPAEANDYCGVHTNSGVLNYWFYLLCNGGSGTNDISNAFSVSGIGTAKGADIAYQTELMLTPTSTYAGCRTASISAATALYGVCSPEVEAVTRAWYAVGVGSNYTTPTLPAITGASSICQGSNTTFSIASVGGTWLSSNTSVATVGSATGTVSGIASGTTRITYNGGACIATKIITVNPLPISSPITVPASVCGEGDFVYITTPGPDYSYIVTTHPDNIYQSSSWSERLRVYNNTTSTIYATVYYIATNTCGYDTASYPIEIKPVPTNIVGSNIMNVTNTDTLTNSVIGGTWNVNYTDKATINPSTGVINAVASGLVTVTYTLPAGCYKTFLIAIDDGYPNAVGKINTIIGNGTAGYSPDGTSAESAMVSSPYFVDIDSAGNIYYFDNYYLRKKTTDNIITTIAGTGVPRPFGEELIFTYSGLPATSIPLRGTTAMTVDKYGNVYLAGAGGIEIIDIYGNMALYAGDVYYNLSFFPGFLVDVPAIGASIGQVFGMSTDKDGNVYYVDYDGGTVNKIDKTTNLINTVAGMGTWNLVLHDYFPYDNVPATSANIIGPRDVAIGKDGSIYIAETYGGTLMRVDTTGILKVISGVRFAHSSTYGNGGPALLAGFDASIIEVDTNNNVYTSNGYVIRKINNEGIINAFAGTGSIIYNGECKNADVANIYCYEFVVDKDGGLIFAEGGNNRIRKIQNPDLYSPIITGRFTLTTDDTSQLAASLPTGTWSSSNTSVATVDATGKVISLSVGTTTISYMLADTCRSPIATAVINVTIAPEDTLTLSGITSICTGTSSTIAASISGGTWTSSNTSIATVNTAGIVTGVAPGTSILSYIVSDSTGTDTATVIITVVPSAPDTPTIVGTDVVCANNDITLSASFAGGTWSSSNTTVATIDSTSGSLTALTTGTSIITYSISNACGTANTTKSITVNPTPSSINSSTSSFAVTIGNTITLNCLPAGGTWSSSNANAIVNTVTGVVTGIATGSTNISYTNIFGCNRVVLITITTPIDSSVVRKIYTIAGTGVHGFSGDGGLAIDAKIYHPSYLTKDAIGNVYFSDIYNRRVRKIATNGTISTVAGNGMTGLVGEGVPATATQIPTPIGLAIDALGNLYIVEFSTSTIRKVDTSGIITTFAGNGISSSSGDGGLATSASFHYPSGIAIDNAGNVYVTEQWGNKIRKIAHSTNIVSTIAGTGEAGYSGNGGPAVNAKISAPNFIFVDSANNIFFTDNGNHALRKINNYGIISTVAGNGLLGSSGNGGAAIAARLNYPAGATMDAEGNIYISDYGNDMVRKINTSGVISAFAGTGAAGYNSDCRIPTTAQIKSPLGIIMSNDGGIILSDEGNSRIRKIHTSNYPSISISGDSDICIGNTSLLVSSYSGSNWISSNTSVATVSTTGLITGIGIGTAIITFIIPDSCGYALATKNISVTHGPSIITSSADTFAVAIGHTITLNCLPAGGTWSSSNSNATVNLATGVVSGVAIGTANISYTNTSGCYSVVSINIIPLPDTVLEKTIYTIAGTGIAGFSGDGGLAINAKINKQSYFAKDISGNIYFSDRYNRRVRKIATNGIITTVAGNGTSGSGGDGGPATAAQIAQVSGLTLDADGNLYISDYDENKIRKVNTAGIITTFAGTGASSSTGDGGHATAASLQTPMGLSVDHSGNLLVIEQFGHRVRKIAPGSNIISTIIGTGVIGYSGNGGPATAATISYPNTIFVDSADNIYLTDNGNHALRKINTAGIISTIAGNGLEGFSGDGGPATSARLDYPAGATMDATGNIYIADYGNHRIRKINTSGIISTYAGTGSPGFNSDCIAPTTAKIYFPLDVIISNDGGLLISDESNNRIRKVHTSNNIPVLLSGTTELCNGSTSTLTSSHSGGTWTSNNTSVATVSATGVVTATGVGTATISYTNLSACGYASGSIVVNVAESIDLATITGASELCTGSSTTLSSSTTGGSWTSSNVGIATVGSTGTVTGIGAGVVVISYTKTNGCGTAIATKTITVNTTIAAGTITGPIAVYTGNNISLSATPAGGVWSSSNTAVATVNTTGTVSGVSMGSVVISYSQGSTCGGDTATHLIEVFEVLSTNITGATTVCSGASTSLSNATSGGTWSSSNTAIATINSTSGVATGLAVGTAIISYKVAPGYLAIATLTVNTVPEIASISGATDVCVGSTSALSSATSGGFWYSTNSGIVTVNASGLATGVSLGSAAIVYAVSGVCGIGFNSVVMNVSNPSPITGADNVCVSATITLTNSSAGGTWSSSNANATVSTSGIVTGISAGTVIISYSLPCGTLTKLLTINPLPNVGTISGAATVNAGSTTTFTTTGTSGTWSSSDISIATISSTGVVNGISAGSATISYTASNSCGTNSATKSITVLPVLETGVTGTLNVCVSGTTALSNTTAGGTWSSGNTSVATISSSGVVTGIAAGTAVISYSLYDSYVTAIVTVNTMPVLGTISGSSSVCVGNSNSLTNATTGGTWSSSNETVATVGAAGSVTGVGEGTATITYSVTNACGTSVATKVQTVLPLPVVAVISGASTICRTTTTTLTSSVSGGTWSSNYTAGASVSATGVVTGLANGNYIISYRTTNSCGTSYASHAVSVISAPVSYAISGTATVCQSATTTLSNAAAGGSWSSSNTSVATVAPTTGVVTGVTTGTANITYNITNFCGSASASKIVTVNPLPVSGIISGTTTLSAGTSATLSSSVSSGTWLSANTAVATINSTTGLLNGISGGVTTISYTKTNSCGSAITTVAVTITAAITPITGTRVVCVNANTTLANTTSGGTWSIADGAIATVNSSTGVVTGVSSGTTTVTYTFSGSGNTTAIITVNPTPATYTGSGIICTGSQLNLGSIIPGCTWSSSTPARASVVTATGIVTGGATLGTVNISYTNTSSCRTITQLTVNGAVANITGLSSPCVGGTFTALNSTSGGTWSSSNTARATIHPTSGLVTAVGGGTVTLTYSVSTGCYKTATATIGTPPNITGNASACVGATTTLVSSGGTWSSSNTSIATVAGSGVVTGISLGTANITYRSSSNSACFVTKEVTVNAMPTAITPATVVCPGATATLTSSPTGGVWTSNNSSTASVDATSGVVTGVVNNFSGISIVGIRYTLPSTCSVTTLVTVNPLPAPIGGGNRNICIAGTTTLTSSTSGATWSSTNPSIATITVGGAVTGVAAGLATISYTNSLGCANTAVVTVNAIPGANTGTATLCIPSGTTTLSNPAGSGTWSSSNTSRASVNLSTGVVTGINTGTANITYTKAAGCISVTQVTVSSCSARPELTDESVSNANVFTVAPNPTTGAINITTDLPGTISVFSIDGKQIVQSEVKQGTNSITLPSDIKTGIYLLRFVGSDGVIKSVRLVYNQ